MLEKNATLLAGRDALRRLAVAVKERLFHRMSAPNPHKTHRNYYVASRLPLIIITSEGVQDLALMSECVGARKAHFIVMFWWSKETATRAKEVRHFYTRHRTKFPRHDVTFVCNTPGEHELLKRLHVPSVYCNQNCLLDESRYHIVPGAVRKYDAVYNGRLEKMKRHLLLVDTPNLALIVGLTPGASADKRAYREHVRAALPDAAVLNYSDARPLRVCDEDHFPQIPPEEISARLGLAHVGVILSREEGACYASAEYLLTGLPLVSTPSRGGRDIFFDNEYVEIVADEPGAVARGVRRLIERNMPAERVREGTLRKMQPHRETFVRLLQSIYDKEGVRFDVRANWESLYTDKMIRYARRWPDDFLADIGTP
jgi:glycosyltransferase involved in cell wall biosynthesis